MSAPHLNSPETKGGEEPPPPPERRSRGGPSPVEDFLRLICGDPQVREVVSEFWFLAGRVGPGG